MTQLIFRIEAKAGGPLDISGTIIGELDNPSPIEDAIARTILASVSVGLANQSRGVQIVSHTDGSAKGAAEIEKVTEMIRSGLEKGKEAQS